MKTYTQEELKKILEDHKKWLDSDGGVKANLHYSDLRCSDLRGSDLSGSDLSCSNLRCSNLSGSDLSYSDLSYSDLSCSNLSGSDLRGSDLSYSDLSYSDLRCSNLRGSNLSCSNLRGSNLSGSNLSGSDLSCSNLSGSKGLWVPDEWLKENLEQTKEGYIAYKSFGSDYAPPKHWKQEPGEIISEVVNPLPTLDCACGVNVSTREWQKDRNNVWKVLIRWEWAASIVVPYNTDGKFRCGKCQLIEVVQ